VRTEKEVPNKKEELLM